jgi:hypothetical protein
MGAAVETASSEPIGDSSYCMRGVNRWRPQNVGKNCWQEGLVACQVAYLAFGSRASSIVQTAVLLLFPMTFASSLKNQINLAGLDPT